MIRTHQSRWPNANRSMDSIRREFAALYRKRVQTGDPRIPPSVFRAKDIRAEMTARVDMVEEEGAEVDVFFSEDERERNRGD